MSTDNNDHSTGAQDIDDLPPGRMNATRGPPRLSPSLHPPEKVNSILKKRIPDQRGRSRSPHHSKKTISTTTSTDGNSSISSLDDLVDRDILYDRQGLVELDFAESKAKMHNSREFSNLPSVNERLSEDTLEDCHAFSDLVYSSNVSRASGGTGTEALLDPLVEDEEETEMLDDIDEEDSEDRGIATVILTNMENLALGSSDDNGAGSLLARDGGTRTGESSVLEDSAV
ncbi:hypothetical protein FisN_13Hh329 [Fistulifera solaris]|jgi:hypothetical protein|uniref:Uncharacterized protein n=1 Tax=Fistulifera solaris TaxID=1519565 RepID=A0A1Z5KMM7_FISSO|nr:hypothetical protein FisN_13Hh329 [Fistulifera solaris]|eukprot:GAX27583.1 hypothetical protein FisN_13Hh329 [Fistulifera solaris]